MGDRAVSVHGRSSTRGWTVSILLLSLGGGGGNILRSLKALFRRDLMVTQKTDAKYAERLRRAVSTRFVDTNEFSLSDVPLDERFLIGPRTTGRLGARHNPDVARQALEESRREVEALVSGYSVVIVIGTGGKGTGAGTMFPVTQIAREQKRLVIPIFVRPSFERHEVDKRRFDHALCVIEQFDRAQIRLIEILNDQGYADTHPEPQSVVWERMNLPIARGLRGLIYVLSDLSQVDPSDISTLFAGSGRLRIGFSEIDPSASHDPDDRQVEDAVRDCWQNSYYAFSKPVGTSLVCIQGEWSNVVDARIKGGLAALAAGDAVDDPYNPLYARVPHAPRPWGVTALFAEYTGNHPPLVIDWTLEKKVSALRRAHDRTDEPVQIAEGGLAISRAPAAKVSVPAIEVAGTREMAQPMFASLWEFAVAINRGAAAALALARDGTQSEIPIDGREVRKLLGTVWFRGVVPRLSQPWRERILKALVASAPIPDHMLKVGRHGVRLSQLSHVQLQDVFTKTAVAHAARADLQLLLTVANLWGEHALEGFRFAAVSDNNERSRFTSALQGLRNPT
jgi:cell division GTPase FtsZ